MNYSANIPSLLLTVGARSVAGWTETVSDALDRPGKQTNERLVPSTSLKNLDIEETLTPPPISPPWGTNEATAGSSNESAFEIVPLQQNIQGVYKTVKLPCHILKPHVPNLEFYGREGVLHKLHGALGPSSTSTKF